MSAERLSTAGFEAFPGRAFLGTVDGICNATTEHPHQRHFVRTKPTPGGVRHLREVDYVRAYGHRPREGDCWWLSPYEFTMYWAVVPARVPQTRDEWETEPDVAWDVKLTPAGERYMRKLSPQQLARLRPGQHYRTRVEETSNRLRFPLRAMRPFVMRGFYNAGLAHYARILHILLCRGVLVITWNKMQRWPERTLGPGR